MINEIKRRLEAGEKVELECIERSLFLNVDGGVVFDENLEILESGLVVDRVSVSTISLLDCPHPIMIDEIQYFKIKEKEPNFDDLIDVATQAGKDGVLIGVRVDFGDVRCLRVEYSSGEPVDQIFDYHDDYSEYVERIKSRYTETFVIESSKDILKINEDIQSLVLANGRDIIDRVYFEGSRMRLRDCSGGSISLMGIDILKGATVTQRKSKK